MFTRTAKILGRLSLERLSITKEAAKSLI